MTRSISQAFFEIAVLPALCPRYYNKQVFQKLLLSPAAGARVADDSPGKPFAFPQQAAVTSP